MVSVIGGTFQSRRRTSPQRDVHTDTKSGSALFLPPGRRPHPTGWKRGWRQQYISQKRVFQKRMDFEKCFSLTYQTCVWFVLIRDSTFAHKSAVGANFCPSTNKEQDNFSRNWPNAKPEGQGRAAPSVCPTGQNPCMRCWPKPGAISPCRTPHPYIAPENLRTLSTTSVLRIILRDLSKSMMSVLPSSTGFLGLMRSRLFTAILIVASSTTA